MNDLGQLLRDARVSKGLTIKDVAPMVRAGESQVSTWERNIHRPSPRFIGHYIEAGLITTEQAARAYFHGDPHTHIA